MRLLTFPHLAVLMISATCLCAQTAAPALRTWTSTDGRQLEAAFVAPGKNGAAPSSNR